MEEADEFIKEACKHVECSFADDDEIEFSTPQIFEFLVRCIWKIDSSSKQTMPSYVYPKEITARLHLANAISTHLQKFHIRGDTALHTVLYGNINNLRSAFIELIRKLPTETQENVDKDRSHNFFVKTVGILKAQPAWVPAYCRGLGKKQQWIPSDNSAERYPLSMLDCFPSERDSRQWIAQYINSHDTGSAPMNIPMKSKPALPPKPTFVTRKEDTVQETAGQQSKETAVIEVDESAGLQLEYDAKLKEYRELQAKRCKVEEQSAELRNKLAQFDPILVEAMKDPEAYAEKFLRKISELNKQMEEDTLQMEERKKEAALRKLEVISAMRKRGVQKEEIERIEEMKAALEDIDAKTEHNIALAEKLKKKIAEAPENNFYDYEQRSRDLDEMVRKQEIEMLRMQEERTALRKQQERENEALNRSFAIIYNILLQHCETYRGRSAMESFTRIHLYCLEIMEMLRENGALKQAVSILESEIFTEQQKRYDKQFDLMNKDFQEISSLNEELIVRIRLQNPSFQPPQL
ncbi:unnamed protein product [Caenorhabditis sp. 36 PRJEB53466]|nr:unnamed protein product [Caenorhabditis sp. 36 PRJEB53466]